MTSDLLRALILIPLVAVHSTSMLWIVYGTAFFAAAVANFAGPFSRAAIPHVVGEEDLPAANAAFSAANWIAVVIGSPLGGFVLQVLGLHGVVLIDALTFVASGVLISRVGARLQIRVVVPSVGRSVRAALLAVWDEWVVGLRYILHVRWVRVLFLVLVLSALGNSMILVILAPFVRHVLRQPPQAYGWMLTVQGIGGVTSSLAIGHVAARIAAPLLLGASILCLGVLELVIALVASLPVTLVGTFRGGLCILFLVVSQNTMLQSRIPDGYRGRVFGVELAVGAIMGLLGSLLAGLLGDTIRVRVAFGAGGVLFMAAGVVAIGVLVPAARHTAGVLSPS